MKADSTSLRRTGFIALLLVGAQIAAAQNTGQYDKSTYMSNPLFIVLLVVIILLMALIAVMGNTLQNIAKSDFLLEKLKKAKDKRANGGTAMLLIFLAIGNAASAQNNAKTNEWLIGGLDYWTFWIMVSIILCEAAVLAVLFVTMKKLLREEEKAMVTAVAKPKEKTLMDVLNASVEIENEAEIMMDHEYDGIRELDNNLPPWWKYGFYVTVVIAVFYMMHYHVTHTGDLQEDEFKKEVARGEAAVAAFLKNSANNVDETSVKLLTAPADIVAGKEIFVSICATCHGKLGEGNSIGPNLTDDYWLHGGSVVDVFKTIKYGWPDKGMQSWKEAYSPIQIAQLTSFVKSLRGTNPPNARERQGDAYIEATSNDSASVKPDSLKIIPVTDSLNKKVAELK